MDLLLRIIWILVPLLLGTYLSTRSIRKRIKIVTWIICLIVSVAGVLTLVQGAAEKKKKDDATKYYQQLSERHELHDRGLPTAYIDGLGENPLLKHFFNEGQKYENEYKFKEAIEEYSKCLSHPEATEENRVAANILIGNCYYAQSRFTEAEKHYREALDISKGVKNEKEKLEGKAAALGNLGIVLQKRGELDGALENYEKALEAHKRTGRCEGMAANYGNMGILLRQKGDPDGALEHHKKALDINQRIGRAEGMADNYCNIGIVLADQGDLEGALQNYKKALKIDQEIGDLSRMADDYSGIGVVLSAGADLNGALLYHKKDLEINQRIGQSEGVARGHCNIGIVLAQKGDLGGALEEYERALKIFEELGQPAGEAHTYINIANIHLQRKDCKSAALLQLQALRIYSRLSMKPDVERARRNLAVSIRKLKEQAKYEEFLEKEWESNPPRSPNGKPPTVLKTARATRPYPLPSKLNLSKFAGVRNRILNF